LKKPRSPNQCEYIVGVQNLGALIGFHRFVNIAFQSRRPTDISIPFWLVAYDTKDFFADEEEPEQRVKGISLVSPVGFSRYFEENNKQYAYSDAVEFDENYKELVEKWPDRDWCTKRLEKLNPALFKESKLSFLKRIFK
jgi:hypothetical protein